MALARLSGRMRRRVAGLLRSAGGAIGLRLCFHDRLGRAELPEEWRTHPLAPCMAAKSIDNERCFGFDGVEVHRALAGNPDGRIHRCPAGYTELAVPVTCEGEAAGILFAGVCWTEDSEPPLPELVVPPGAGWLEDRLVVLRAVAVHLGELLRGEPSYVPPDRRGRWTPGA